MGRTWERMEELFRRMSEWLVEAFQWIFNHPDSPEKCENLHEHRDEFSLYTGEAKKKAGLNGRNTRKSWCRKELYNSLHPAHVSHHMEFNRFFEAFPLTDFPSKFTLNTIFRWKIGSLLILWILRQHTCITSFAENWGGNLIFFSPRQ